MDIFKPTLHQLNADNTQDKEQQYSHKFCHSNDYNILDYFYVTPKLQTLIDGQMKYEHLMIANKKEYKKENETICKGYSDHIPISVQFKTTKVEFKYKNTLQATNQLLHTFNHAKQRYYNQFDQYEPIEMDQWKQKQISTFTDINSTLWFSIICIIITCISFIFGILSGFIASKTKQLHINI